MESKATAKFVRVSPRKTRLVARNVKGMPVEAAMNLLRFTPNKPAGVILGVVRSALANAEHNASMDVDALVVKEILVNEVLPGSGSCRAPRAAPPTSTSVPVTLP